MRGWLRGRWIDAGSEGEAHEHGNFRPNLEDLLETRIDRFKVLKTDESVLCSNQLPVHRTIQDQSFDEQLSSPPASLLS
jgi:hypothetical protein